MAAFHSHEDDDDGACSIADSLPLFRNLRLLMYVHTDRLGRVISRVQIERSLRFLNENAVLVAVLAPLLLEAAAEP